MCFPLCVDHRSAFVISYYLLNSFVNYSLLFIAWPPAYGGMVQNNRYGGQHSSGKGGSRNGSMGGMNPAAAAAAAVLAAEYTRVHHVSTFSIRIYYCVKLCTWLCDLGI